MDITKAIEIEGLVLMINVVDGQRRGYLFQKFYNGFVPKAYSRLSETNRVKLLQEEIDVYCVWGADDQAFGFYDNSYFKFI